METHTVLLPPCLTTIKKPLWKFIDLGKLCEQLIAEGELQNFP